MIKMTYSQLTSPVFTSTFRKLMTEKEYPIATSLKLMRLYEKFVHEQDLYSKAMSKINEKYKREPDEPVSRDYHKELAQLLNTPFEIPDINKFQVSELYPEDEAPHRLTAVELIALYPILEMNNANHKSDLESVPAS